MKVSLFFRLAHACRDGTTELLDSIDAEIQLQLGISVLADRIMLEAIVCLTIGLKNFPLVKALIARGPPAPRDETRFLWEWRENVAGAYVISDHATTTALLRHHWLIPRSFYTKGIEKMKDEAMAMDRLEVLSVVLISFYNIVFLFRLFFRGHDSLAY